MVKTDRLFSSWPAGGVGAAVGGLYGWEPADLHAHYNFVIVNNNITVIV